MKRAERKCWMCGQPMRARAAILHGRKLHKGLQCTICKCPIEPMIVLKHYLGTRTIQEIKESIQRYNTLDLRDLDDKQLKTEIQRVLMKEDKKRRALLVLPASVSKYKKGSSFSRVRRLSDKDMQRMQKEGINEQRDCYEPPLDMSHAIGRGRLNRPGERILYTAHGGAGWATMACFEELNIKENEWFLLIEYESTEAFTAAAIGPKRFTPAEREHELSDEERKKSEMLLEFVRDKFQARITEDNDHLYRATRLIAREFSQGQTPQPDIWTYPSIAREGGLNVAFDPARKDKLQVKDIKIARCRAHNGEIGARLIEIIYDAVCDGLEFGRRRLFASRGSQAYFAVTYANRVERRLDRDISFIERVNPEQNDRLKNFNGKLVLIVEKNKERGTYISAREAI